MTDFSQRNRKVNLNSFTSEEADRLGEEVGKKTGNLCKELEEKLNMLWGPFEQKVEVALKITDLKTGKSLEPTKFHK